MPSTMDPEMPILPKGFVINTKQIYEEIAAHDVVPMTRAWEIWRVYTTTTKELQDPTARRLENFWWHVLGSDRQRLSGRTLARIFQDISLGPTAVPLKGPPNRWDGDIPPHIIQQAMAILEAEAQHPHQSETALNDSRRLRELSSSAAKPPPSHPILKKPRGPSTSGARPTARFISPHPSEDEAEKDSAPSSASTITPGPEKRQHAPSPSKKKAHGKKFVASKGKAAAKRRPVLPRKNSSQSSVTSESSSKDGPSSGSSRGSGTPVRAPSPIVEGEPYQPTVGSSEPVRLSAKALGKRPMVPTETTAEKLKLPNPAIGSAPDRPPHPSQSPQILEPKISSKAPAPTTADKGGSSPQPLANISNQPKPTSHARSPSLYSKSPSSRSNGSAAFSPSVSSPLASVPMAQSRSHSGFIRPRDRQSSGAAPRPVLFGGATTASITDVAAQGTIIDQGGSVGSIPIPAFYSRQEPSQRNPGSSSSLLDLRSQPTQPSPSASVPLGRTKSQLTLLLEQDEARAKKSWSKS